MKRQCFYWLEKTRTIKIINISTKIKNTEFHHRALPKKEEFELQLRLPDYVT